MKHRILTVLLAIAAALCLCLGPTACGDGTPEEEKGADGHTHIAEYFQVDDNGHWKLCNVCGEKFSVGDHSYDPGNACETCGYSTVYTKGLTYVGSVANTYAVAGPGEATDVTDLIIPAYHEGKPVTAIWGRAFYNCSGLTSVTIGKNVTTIGGSAFSECSELKSITIPDGVISITGGAFSETAYYNDASHWENGEALYIGNHLIKVKDTISGTYTIRKNTKTIAGEAFFGCSGLTSIVIPDGVIAIGDGAFYGCSGLTKIVIPESVISIGYSVLNGTAYYNDPSHWDKDGVLYIGNYLIKAKPTLAGAYTVRAGTKTIAAMAFSEIAEDPEICLDLTSIVIPDSVVSIGMGAFGECTGLKEATIGRGVTSMDWHVFYECTGLERITVDVKNPSYSSQDGVLYDKRQTIIVHVPQAIKGEVTIPNGVTEIENRSYTDGARGETFADCEGLTSIVIPDSVTLIGTSAFYGCTGLESVTIGSGVKTIEQSAFENCRGLTRITITNLAAWCKIDFGTNDANPLYYAKHLYINGAEVKNLTIPATVTKIGSYAFEGCSGLESVTIGNGVTEIGSFAFSECSELTSVTIPDSMTEVGGGAFGWCSKLESVTIPDSVTEIGDRAFSSCSKLTNIHFKGTVAEWQAIDKVKNGYYFDWDYGTGNYTVTCTDGTVDKQGNVTYFNA